MRSSARQAMHTCLFAYVVIAVHAVAAAAVLFVAPPQPCSPSLLPPAAAHSRCRSLRQSVAPAATFTLSRRSVQQQEQYKQEQQHSAAALCITRCASRALHHALSDTLRTASPQNMSDMQLTFLLRCGDAVALMHHSIYEFLSEAGCPRRCLAG